MTDEQFKSFIKSKKSILIAIAAVVVTVVVLIGMIVGSTITPDEMSVEIQEELNGKVNVFYDSATDTYQLDVNDVQMYNDIQNLLVYNTETEKWNDLTEEINQISSSLEDRTDKASSIMLMNPDYPELYLLLARDGNIVYDVTLDGY